MTCSPRYTIVTAEGCVYCDKAKQRIGTYTEFKLDTPDKIATFKALGFRTVPQIIRDGVLIGGYDQL